MPRKPRSTLAPSSTSTTKVQPQRNFDSHINRKAKLNEVIQLQSIHQLTTEQSSTKILTHNLHQSKPKERRRRGSVSKDGSVYHHFESTDIKSSRLYQQFLTSVKDRATDVYCNSPTVDGTDE